ncbi:cbb3-type cytochrome oxidase subunit 3 [Teichococcus oryzae]|uniref:Cbb3-type cytochrome c oxidase subunit 3 n=1 Tax=Teichococcus oryzae TaxID=1608942 RepID=A0A5B2TII5_9PROT|nr:cbb3-type cytochrome c oxidase subunit 3 [Pseudoroseomonas oryzae]KAA2213999.1 cbb3-type cytochrome c oxidase subunit 3 [Pseudoroseomonas oryzae]
MTMLDFLHDWLPSIWVAWFFAVFLLILVRTLRPSRRAALERQAMIPLQDDAG